MGYFNKKRLACFEQKGVYFVSKYMPYTALFMEKDADQPIELSEYLSKRDDTWVELLIWEKAC